MEEEILNQSYSSSALVGSQTHHFAGLLLDMDGTVIDTTPAVIKHWTAFANDIGVPPEVILAKSHGRRAIDTIRLYDESKANWDYVRHAEALMPKLYPHDVREIPGSRDLILAAQGHGIPWAIVTSGTKPYAEEWFKLVSLPLPLVMVNAEDVEHGKPDPACYALACQKLALPLSARMLVVEDAPAGIRAVREAGADWIIKDLGDATIMEWRAVEKTFALQLNNVMHQST